MDKWEQELAQGVVPDLQEGLSVEERAKLAKERSAVARTKNAVGEFMQGSDQVSKDLKDHVLGGGGPAPASAKTNEDWVDLLGSD